MKTVKYAIVVMALLTFFFLEAAMIASPTRATDLPAPTFSAGDWINQGGQTVGCKCPKLSGPCVCEYTTPRVN
jgi:hypothetical protein